MLWIYAKMLLKPQSALLIYTTVNVSIYWLILRNDAGQVEIQSGGIDPISLTYVLWYELGALVYKYIYKKRSENISFKKRETNKYD